MQHLHIMIASIFERKKMISTLKKEVKDFKSPSARFKAFSGLAKVVISSQYQISNHLKER